MRLYNFLLEQQTTSDIINIIKKDCSYFLENTNVDFPLYRGIWYSDVNSNFKKMQVLTNRIPRNTKKEVTKILDESFNDLFKVKARTATLFCTGNEGFAGMYGDLYYIFPINKFDFIWSSKIKDLYIELSTINNSENEVDLAFKLYNR